MKLRLAGSSPISYCFAATAVKRMSPSGWGVGGGEPLASMDYFGYIGGGNQADIGSWCVRTDLTINKALAQPVKFSPPPTPPPEGDMPAIAGTKTIVSTTTSVFFKTHKTLIPVPHSFAATAVKRMSPSGWGVGGGEPLASMDYFGYIGGGNQADIGSWCVRTDLTINKALAQPVKFSPPPTPPPEGDMPAIAGIGIKLFLMFFILTLFSLSSIQTLHAQGGEILNPIQPIQLNSDTTVLYLNDYLTDPSKIEAVIFDNNYKGVWNKAENTATLFTDSKLPALSELKLIAQGQTYTLLLKCSQKKTYTFSFDPKGKTYQAVQLAGEMNDWTPKKNAFVLSGKIWQAQVALNPGVYQYQVVADGKWMLDPGNNDSASNNNGGFNSVFKTPGKSNLVPQLKTGNAGSGMFTFMADNSIDKIFVYWQNTKLDVNYIYNNQRLVTVYLPAVAKQMHRSFIRVYAYNSNGAGNDLLIPLNDGEVLTDQANIDRTDKQAFAIYSILVDRFVDGDTTNDKKVQFKELKAKANYYGGDLAGITQKIMSGYFDSLHVNTLWISPILQNPEGAYKEFPEPHDWYSGYHGYWPISLTKIDYRFGNDIIFKKLVDNAHADNMNVLVDLVANHVHEECPIYKQHPEYATKLDLPDGRKNIRLWDECRLTTWFDTFLPTLDFSNPKVIKLEVDSSLLWVQKFGIDGFRHDATKHIAIPFWRSLTLNLKKIEEADNKPLYQIGETYGSKELIGSYIGSGLLDGQFDFNLFFDARAAFAKDSESFEKMAATLQQSVDFYGYHHLMGNITGNHDQPRFASLAGGGLSFNEDARKAGWDRNVTVGNDIAYSKLANMIAFTATIPGIPVLYYGDEIGMPGAGDPDNRRMMRFDNLSEQESALKQKVGQIFALRASHLSLTYGDFKLLRVTTNTLVYQRTYFGETALIVFNNAQTTQWVSMRGLEEVPEKYQPQFNSKNRLLVGERGGNSKTGRVELPAKSFEIFIASK